ncbi:hypothetical protein RFI_26522 [Reticulomyxa filosa]|uniref:Uncharacterized protein n=1 Tax=Reticulomyxa filosa TaxID=46433 RepID=X6MCU8_RETFI|nr:hypothetical protein RFI_26522 [Reticulomyxa filosa]|eukprot:ETO10855.1 hypothetical protein RFI_26522 [Reticulomyxa filosa]
MQLSKRTFWHIKQALIISRKLSYCKKHFKESINEDFLMKNLYKRTMDLCYGLKDIKNELTLKIQLDKLKQLCDTLSGFPSIYNLTCRNLTDNLIKCVCVCGKSKKCIGKNQLEKMSQNLESLVKMLLLQSHLVSTLNIKTEIENVATLNFPVIKRVVKDEFDSKKEEKDDNSSSWIEKLIINDIKLLEKNVMILETAMNVFESPCENFNLCKSTKELFHSFLNEIIVYFDKIRFVDVMDEQRTERSYSQIIVRISGFMCVMFKKMWI